MNIRSINYGWIVWSIAAFFYGFEFIQRVAGSILANPLMQEFHLDPATLGLVMSFYFYAYAAAQIPVGILLDKYGVRRAMTFAAISVAMGTFLFAYSHHIGILVFARILIGVGSAFAFVSCLKLALQWFPNSHFALIVGLTNTLGVIGALFGEEPLSFLIAKFNWQQTFIGYALIALLFAFLAGIFIRNHPKSVTETSNKQLPKKSIYSMLIAIIKQPQSWIISLYAGLMVAPIIAFAELWAVPFLQNTYHLNSELAAGIDSFVFIGIAVGGPINGLISDFITKRKPVMFFGNLLAIGLLTLIISITYLTPLLLFILFFFYGFFTSSMLLCFPLHSEKHSKDLSGTAIAFTNTMIMAVGALFQFIIGLFLNLDHNFEYSVIILPTILLLNLLLLIFIKEKKRHANES